MLIYEKKLEKKGNVHDQACLRSPCYLPRQDLGVFMPRESWVFGDKGKGKSNIKTKDMLYALRCLFLVFVLFPTFMVSLWIILEYLTGR
jgi:hypothetical protein